MGHHHVILYKQKATLTFMHKQDIIFFSLFLFFNSFSKILFYVNSVPNDNSRSMEGKMMIP